MKLVAYVALLLVTAISQAAPCAAPENRQFDFWIGDWQVHRPDGSFAGMNRITLEYGGCVLHEHYATGRGYSGESLNTYDPARKVWHQTWVDDSGLLLQLDGALVNGRMVLSGETVDSTGHTVKQRITWERMDGGKVRQRWDSSPDGVKWQLLFEGIYSPAHP